MTGKVLVIGATNVDLVVHCQELPKAGETVVGPQVQQFGGGKGANAAIAAARAGAEVRFCSAVGNDSFGQCAQADLGAENIDVSDIAVLKNVATGTALIVVDAKGENQIAVGAGANAHLDETMIAQAFSRAQAWADVVLLSTEIPADAILAAGHQAHKIGATFILNPAPVLPELKQVLAFAPILTPNASELCDLYNLLVPTKTAPSIEDMAQRICQESGAPVIVTLGAKGVLVCEPGTQPEIIAAPKVADVQDTTGAGDTFNGVLAQSLAGGMPLKQAAVRAVFAASLSVKAIGARSGMPFAAQIDV